MNSKRCPRCGKTKPVASFYQQPKRYDGMSAYCRVCERIRRVLRYHTDDDAVTRFLYAQKIARREYNRQRSRTEKRRAYMLAYGQTPWAKVNSARRTAEYRLRHATGPDVQERLRKRLEMIQAEIDRMRQRRNEV